MPIGDQTDTTLRKRPVQARSRVTVELLIEAAFQVLEAGGYSNLTTTRVAERAGVSVGTLYQYFPDRSALATAAAVAFLDDIADRVAARLALCGGMTLDQIVAGFVRALTDAKFARPQLARAVRELLAVLSLDEQVRSAIARGAVPLADALASCPTARFREPQRHAMLSLNACSALIESSLCDMSTPEGRTSIAAELGAMLRGYLRECADA